MVTDNTDKEPLIVFAISGFAGAGKDTLADSIASNLPKGVHSMKIKMADALKHSVQIGFNNIGLRFDAFTDNRKLKEAVRPLLVEYGKFCRSVDRDVFADYVAMKIKDHSEVTDIVFVSDVRYINEYNILKNACEENNWTFVPMYISYGGVKPANEEELNSISILLEDTVDDDMTEIEIDKGDMESFDTIAKEIVEMIYE